MNQIDTIKLAMDALEPFITPNWAGSGVDEANAAYTALRSALSEQPAQQEPVGEWGDGRSDAKRILWKPGYVVAAKVGDKLYAAPQPAQKAAPVQQEPVTLMNNLALTIASYAISYRELVWNLSEKVMGVAMSAESVKGQANRVQVTAEAMSDLRSFVENGVTEKLAFWDKLFDRHKAAAWKLNAAPQPAHRKPLTPEKVVKLKDAFYAGFESYVTPAAPCSDVDEEWAKYKSAHNIKENT